ncbi:dehydrogenase/reductase-like protein [Sarcoptes scabiei]|nr:dehydrogenase/reductase-like protein [Sarcoptes scabiei]
MSHSRPTFNDKVIIITGSSSGIGEEIAVHLCSLGANITITGRNADRLRNVRNRCLSFSTTDKILEVIADVNKDDDLDRILQETLKKFGKLDVLVNNAGIYKITPIECPDYMQLYDELFRTNLRSVVYLTKISTPYLIQTKGNIVNISSVASYKPAPTNTLYAMTKCALDMFTKSLALELGKNGVRCNAINPAAIRTPIFDKLESSALNTELMVEAAKRSYPLGRIGEPEDCANAVAYLASDQAAFINGVCLLVDGGSVYTNLIMPDNS